MTPIEQAKKEIEDENFRALVDAEKEKIRKKKSLIDRIFKWKIKIIRKDNAHD